jgi:D-3-phosphoglycerate dehydrogenase
MALMHRTVVILEPGYGDYETERAILSQVGAEIVPIAQNRDVSAYLAALDPVAILVRERPVTAEDMGAAKNLKAIVRYGVGVDNIDLEAASERHVVVANVPDYGVEEVSDHALALYLAVARRLVTRDRQVRQGGWNLDQSQPVHRTRDQCLGIIGFGRIARRVLAKFRPLGFARILVADPELTDEAVTTHQIEPADLDLLCREADAITLHVPLTPATKNLIDRRRIALMKPTCVIINTARGGLVDEMALADALRAGRLFGAGLDVFATEPPAADHPLFNCSNVVVTDHMAWYSVTAATELQAKAAEEVRRVLSDERPNNWVNPWPGASAS